MKFVLIVLFAATTAIAQQVQVPVAKIADDAKVIDRVAEVSKGNELPKDLLRRIVYEDIELLRGRRADGTYAYASYERMEASRVSESFSVQPSSEDRTTKLEIHAEFGYRLTIGLPQRRMLVTKNRPLWVENAEVEYIPQGSSEVKRVNFPIKTTMEAGETRNIDIPDIGRQVTARVFARAQKDSGYGNIVLTVIQAKVFDNPDSPYADAVTSAKSIQRNLDQTDLPSLRALAQRMQSSLHVQSPVPSVAPMPSGTTVEVSAGQDVYGELQAIEDLLTGNDAERRTGLDRLHQLLRKMRR